MQYLYETDGQFCFMDSVTYEQMFFNEKDLGDSRDLLKENMELRRRYINLEAKLTVLADRIAVRKLSRIFRAAREFVKGEESEREDFCEIEGMRTFFWHYLIDNIAYFEKIVIVTTNLFCRYAEGCNARYDALLRVSKEKF